MTKQQIIEDLQRLRQDVFQELNRLAAGGQHLVPKEGGGFDDLTAQRKDALADEFNDLTEKIEKLL